MKLAMKEMFGEDCLRQEDGEKVYSLIHPEILADHDVELDFSGVRVAVSLFLNPAIGRLYADIPVDRIRERLHIEKLADAGKFALKTVVENAKAYYGNERFRQAVDHSIDALEA